MNPRPALPDGVKATSGGQFDPEQHLIYFLAGNTSDLRDTAQPQVLVAVNELESKSDFDNLDRLLDEGRKVFLDSGIFNLAMDHARRHDVTHDIGLSMPPEEIDGFDELWDRYANVVTKYIDRLWGVVELDQGGVEHKPRTRARIETELGVTPIPVYHPFLDGWDYYDTLAGGYDRICFGNLVKAHSYERQRLLWTAAERAREYPYLWTHLLGVTPNQNLIATNFRGSADSSSWLASMRWPHSWTGFTYLAPATRFPHGLWPDVGTYAGEAEYGDAYLKAWGIAANTAYFQHRMIEPLSEDTHPWL